MKKVSVQVEDFVYEFYSKIAENTAGRSAEQVMADALFLFAGKLAKKVGEGKKNSLQ